MATHRDHRGQDSGILPVLAISNSLVLPPKNNPQRSSESPNRNTVCINKQTEENDNLYPRTVRDPLNKRQGAYWCSVTHGKSSSAGTKVRFNTKCNNSLYWKGAVNLWEEKASVFCVRSCMWRKKKAWDHSKSCANWSLAQFLIQPDCMFHLLSSSSFLKCLGSRCCLAWKSQLSPQVWSRQSQPLRVLPQTSPMEVGDRGQAHATQEAKGWSGKDWAKTSHEKFVHKLNHSFTDFFLFADVSLLNEVDMCSNYCKGGLRLSEILRTHTHTHTDALSYTKSGYWS